MKKIIGHSIMLLVLVAWFWGVVVPAEAAANATIFFDDFNDNYLDPEDWTCWATQDNSPVDPSLWIANTNERLEFDIPTAGAEKRAACKTRLSYTGEAVYEVDFQNGCEYNYLYKHFNLVGEYQGSNYVVSINFRDAGYIQFAVGIGSNSESINLYPCCGTVNYWNWLFHLKIKRNADGTFTATVTDEFDHHFEATSTITFPLDVPLYMQVDTSLWSMGNPTLIWYDNAKITTLYRTVSIDIKPGSDQNSINLSSAGVIPVAILSSDTFDATSVDPETVSLAGSRVKMVGRIEKYLCHEEDVNEDELMDLVCKIQTIEDLIVTGESIAVLEAETFDGTPVRGEDNVRIVPDN